VARYIYIHDDQTIRLETIYQERDKSHNIALDLDTAWHAAFSNLDVRSSAKRHIPTKWVVSYRTQLSISR
jgi:hypothetical protein